MYNEYSQGVLINMKKINMIFTFFVLMKNVTVIDYEQACTFLFSNFFIVHFLSAV
jgi:hypothetical protein